MNRFSLSSAFVLLLAVNGADAQSITFNNVVNYSGFGFQNGGAAVIGANTITRMHADDITTLTSPGPANITNFRFSVANFNATAVSARPLIRFYDNNGTGGGPGTFLGGFNFNAIAFGVGVTTFGFSPGTPLITDGTFWAGMTFDNNNGTTGATLAQLNNLGQGIFDPPTVGSSADRLFQTTAAGDFVVNNPAGAFFDFGGTPVASYGWQFTTIPEPSAFALVGVVSLFALVRRQRRLSLR